MKCPNCPSFNLKVVETRAWPSCIWRRRRCLDCLKDLWTQEKHVPDLTVSPEFIRTHSIPFRKLENI